MTNLHAQESKTGITGVYLLTGVMETASAIELKADSSFEFFFSQGALDRGGKGRWSVNNGRVMLNTVEPRPPKDYALVKSQTIAGAGTVIKMVDKNTMILSYSDVTLKTTAGFIAAPTNSTGEARFKQKHAVEIRLLFRLCPDRSSVFTVNPQHNYFEFRLEPWVAEIFFKDFPLTINGNELNGAHPLLEGSSFRYVKENEQ